MIYKNEQGKWYRVCPKCNSNIFYIHKRSAYTSDKKNSICRLCSKFKIFDGVYFNKNNQWCRICPECKKELPYKSRQICIMRFHRNSLCKSCYQKGEKAFWYGKHMTEKIKRKMSRSQKGKKLSKETRLKLSLQKQGDKNPFFEKKFSKKHKENLRISALKRLKEQKIIISYNPKACEFMDEYGKKNNYNFQHALNGGEVKISGYLVDGYDKDKNIIFEYDEKHHRYGKSHKKDLIRQINIINNINPNKFLRYNEWDNILYDALTNIVLPLNNP